MTPRREPSIADGYMAPAFAAAARWRVAKRIAVALAIIAAAVWFVTADWHEPETVVVIQGEAK